jgi:murein DD-endopeptidase MepM/ murein hydrolase activator NlpD
MHLCLGYAGYAAIACSGANAGRTPHQARTNTDAVPESVSSDCKVVLYDGYRPSGNGQPMIWKPNPSKPHRGIDIAECDGKPIISIGSGTVVAVAHDPGLKPPTYTGGVVTIIHDVPGTQNQVRMFSYFHLTGILVESGQHVKRGDPLGYAWKVPHESWKPHVHLMIIESTLPVEQRDPLLYITRCLSEVGEEEAFVFPVPC